MTKISYGPMSAMQLGRIGKALDRRYRYDSGIMTLGQFLDAHTVTAKHTDTQEYSDHKANGEYSKLAAPKVHYTITIEDGSMYDVPKIVFDCITPESSVTRKPYTFAECQIAIAEKIGGSGIEWMIDADWENWRDAYNWILNTPMDLLKDYAAGYRNGERLITP